MKHKDKDSKDPIELFNKVKKYAESSDELVDISPAEASQPKPNKRKRFRKVFKDGGK